MEENPLIQLTGNLYRLTLLFPKKEPLRYKIREKAIDILTKPNEKDLDILDSFFEVALIQQWVRSSELLEIKEKYNSLRQDFKSKPKEVQEKAIPKSYIPQKRELSPVVIEKSFNGGMNNRQEKILDFLKENGRAQVWQIKEFMPDITKRTLRRDFEYMLRQGTIKRIGERNETFYQIKVNQA